MIESSAPWPLTALLAIAAFVSFIVSALLVLALWPVFNRHWVTSPNARSSHRKPTPQGGGIAVITATLVVAGGFIAASGAPTDPLALIAVCCSTIGLAIVGAVDDWQPLSPRKRLIFQAFATATVIAVLPADLRIVDLLPWWLERAVIFVGILWFVNLVNFMDGIDWITVAEVAPVTLGLSVFGAMRVLPPDATFVSIALCGAILGFAPFNRPVAKLFLGDVGSLPIGLLLGWLLLLLAAGGHLAAAILLPLYYLADATITILRRLFNGAHIMQPHRSHFYQRAMNRGLGVYRIVCSVFAVNIVLVGLATMTLIDNALWFDSAMVMTGAFIVAVQIWHFNGAAT